MSRSSIQALPRVQSEGPKNKGNDAWRSAPGACVGRIPSMTAQTAAATAPGKSTRWYAGATRDQWKVFASGYLGWMLDIMDLMLFAMVISHVSADLGFDRGMAGVVASVTLIATAFGGLFFGFLADRIGRTRSL